MNPKDQRKRDEDGACHNYATDGLTHFDHSEGRDYMRPPEDRYCEYQTCDGTPLYVPEPFYAAALGYRAIADGYATALAEKENPAAKGVDRKYGGEYADVYSEGFEIGYAELAGQECRGKRAQEFIYAVESKYGYAGGGVAGPC